MLNTAKCMTSRVVWMFVMVRLRRLDRRRLNAESGRSPAMAVDKCAVMWLTWPAIESGLASRHCWKWARVCRAPLMSSSNPRSCRVNG